jgi:hypothetical protein
VIRFREPSRTGFELAWTLLGIRFRVFPSFFLVYGIITALFAWTVPLIRNDPIALAFVVALNVGCVFVAILFVSFVEGLVYRTYGLRSTVVVREFSSGLYPETQPPTVLQRIAVALSYPGACFLLLAMLVYSDKSYHWSQTSKIAEVIFDLMRLICLVWAVIGLLPIFPYPGGRVMLEIFSLMSPRHGLAMTLVISILVGIAYIAYSVAVYLGHVREIELWNGVYLYSSLFISIFFALSVMQNWETLQIVRAQQKTYDTRSDEYDDRAPWER